MPIDSLIHKYFPSLPGQRCLQRDAHDRRPHAGRSVQKIPAAGIEPGGRSGLRRSAQFTRCRSGRIRRRRSRRNHRNRSGSTDRPGCHRADHHGPSHRQMVLPRWVKVLVFLLVPSLYILFFTLVWGKHLSNTMRLHAKFFNQAITSTLNQKFPTDSIGFIHQATKFSTVLAIHSFAIILIITFPFPPFFRRH